MVELTQAAVWHRQVAALAAAAQRVGVADEQLPAVRARLQDQQQRFADAARQVGVALPVLAPTPTEIASAAPALGDLSDTAVTETLRLSYSTLDAVDSVLAGHLGTTTSGAPTAPTLAPPVATPAATGPPTTRPVATGPMTGPALAAPPPFGSQVPPPPPGVAGPSASGVAGWSAGPRNALVYGAYSIAVLVIQLVLLAVADEQTLPLLAPACLLVLPAFAWAAGWFTVGMVFRRPPGARGVKRTPRLGAVVCLLPNLLLCAGLGVLFVADRFG